MRYYYHHDNQVLGPIELNELQSYVSTGYLPKTVSCCAEGAESWLAFNKMPTASSVKPAQPPPTPPDLQLTKEYKVLSQKDKWFSQKFDPEILAQALNSYAQQGWRVVAASTATFPGMLGSNREEIIVILEREV